MALLVPSASAAGIYELSNDTSLLLAPAASASVLTSSGSDLALTSETPGEYSQVLNNILLVLSDDIWNDMRSGFEFVSEDLGNVNSSISSTNSILQGSILSALADIETAVNGISVSVPDTDLTGVITAINAVKTAVDYYQPDLSSVTSRLDTLDSSLSVINSSLGTLASRFIASSGVNYLNSSGSSSSLSSDASLTFINRSGFLGLGYLLRSNSGASYLGSGGGVGTLSQNVGISYLIRNGFLGIRELMSLPSGTDYLNSYGQTSTSTISVNLDTLLNNGLQGISFLLRSNADTAALSITGKETTLSSSVGVSYIMRTGFLGLRSMIAGSETDNVYTGKTINNENVSSNVSATGLGPMLNTWLQDIQNDLGVLSYVFASPQDLKLKEESADSVTEFGNIFVSGDSGASVKMRDLTALGTASVAIQDFGNTGVSISEAFDALKGDALFSFFSQAVADDLTTVPSSYSLRSSGPVIVTRTFAQSREDFNDVLAGEGDIE